MLPLPKRRGRDEMTKASINLQELRRRIYVKAKAEKAWRFWGLYTHVCKMETLGQAYQLAKRNNGAPGVDGVTFEDIEADGMEDFLEQLRKEMVADSYRPSRVRKVEIPKDGGRKVRVLSIPTIRDRVVQGALKLILEPIFEADFQPGSFGYRPKLTAHGAVHQVAMAITQGKSKVMDLDLKAYFDNVRHHILLEKVASRVNDAKVMGLLKMILKTTGEKGVPQGGVISPLLSNIYLSEVDKMLERAKEVTGRGRFTRVAYARYADDLVVLVKARRGNEWLVRALTQRLKEEFAKIQVEINQEKSRIVDLAKGETFGFLGFEFKRLRSQKGWWSLTRPKTGKRTQLIRRLKEIFRRHRSQPITRVIDLINPILRGWVNYFAIGNSARCFSYIRQWVEKKVRRHLMRASKRPGFGWKRWSNRWLHDALGLYDDYKVRYYRPRVKALPTR